MEQRYSAQVAALRRSVGQGSGSTSASLRQAVLARAGQHSRGEPSAEIPDDLVRYVDKVALHAYRVTDADVEALRQGGRSEDEIFELTVAAALGAALARLDIANEALEASAS